MIPNNIASRQRLLHLAAALVGLAVFALVYRYSGDSDLLFAVTGGMGGSLLTYLAARLGAPGERS
jgi:hypothetical protein